MNIGRENMHEQIVVDADQTASGLDKLLMHGSRTPKVFSSSLIL